MRVRTLAATLALALLAAPLGALADAQAANPRYGKWRLRSTDPAKPSTNVMTYEPFNGTGMKITINTLNPDGTLTPNWGYTTMFDGKFEAMTGRNAADTASVKIVTDRINEITYKRDGRINQILTNVLAPDGQSIGIIYMNLDAEGKTARITFATYDKMQ